jgi:thioredoxin-related protein
VVRLNLLSRVGRQAAARYGVRGIPTTVVVDGNGEAIYGQYGLPLANKVVAQVDMLLATN